MRELRDPFSVRRRETVSLGLSLVAVFVAGLYADWLMGILALAVASTTLRNFWNYLREWRAYTDAQVELARVLGKTGMGEDELADALYTMGPLIAMGPDDDDATSRRLRALREWVSQGRTDAFIAHQLECTLEEAGQLREVCGSREVQRG